MGRPVQASNTLVGKYSKKDMKQRLEAEKKIIGSKDNFEAPDFLKHDKEALSKFESLVKELTKVDLLINVDVDLLAIYAETWAKYVKCTKMLMLQDLVEEQYVKGGQIARVANPYVKIQETYVQRMMKLASLFGLSPADRIKLAHINPSDKEDKPDVLISLLSGLKTS